MPDPKKADAAVSAKWQYKQAIAVAVIACLTTLIPAVLKIMYDTKTIAALQEKQHQAAPQNIAGVYRWEWNENGWAVSGSVSTSPAGSAQVTLGQWMRCEAEKMNRKVPLVRQRGPATVMTVDGSSDVNVSLPVQFIRYDRNCRETGMDPEVSIIQGRIKPVAAYWGMVDYVSGRGHFTGNMTLVKEVEGVQ